MNAAQPPTATEVARYAYHDQSYFPGEYVVLKMAETINGHHFGIFVVETGQLVNHPCPVYSTGANADEAGETAYRIANDLPRTSTVYAGRNYQGVSKRSAEIWISKNRAKYEATLKLSVLPVIGSRYQVVGTPLDWGRLEF